MKRQMKASAVALLISGCLLALSAGAAANAKPSEAERKTAAEMKLAQAAAEKEAAQCLDCKSRVNKTMDACTQACPTSDPGKKDAAARCLNKCADRYHDAMAACSSSCPKPPAATVKPPEPSKAP